MKNDFHKLKPFLKPLITLPSPPAVAVFIWQQTLCFTDSYLRRGSLVVPLQSRRTDQLHTGVRLSPQPALRVGLRRASGSSCPMKGRRLSSSFVLR